jgi:M6 family metalloprotease-like protein
MINQNTFLPEHAMRLFKPGLARCMVLAVLACVISTASSLYAVPANPEPADLEQPDGNSVKVHIRGDEFFSWHEDTEGYVIKRDPKDKFWKYTRPGKDSLAFEIIPDAVVGRVSPAQRNLKKRELPDRSLLRKHISREWERSQGKLPVPPGRRPAPGETETSPEEVSPRKTSSPGSEAEAPSFPEQPPPKPIPVSGTRTVRNVVILACFNDHWDSGNSTVLASKGRVDVSEYDALFNEIGHTADSALGSVKDYYREVSYGKLTVDSIVTPWVRLPENEAYYGSGPLGDIYHKQMVADAIAAADAAGFDFSQADSDGDGWVDGLTIIHSGHGEEITGNPSSAIWSHQGAMSAVETRDDVNMYKYHTSPALRGQTTSTDIIRIGVICHEMGHFFGLPDLYDYAGTHTDMTVGNWCVMSTGSWGASGRRPVHFNAWSKQMLGFVAPQLVHSQAALTVPDVTTSDTIYMIRDGFSGSDEYFLVENRNQTGFDASTPGKGIMIWHIAPDYANNDSGAWPHPLVKMEDADGNTTANETSSAWFAGNSSMLAGGFRDQTGNLNTSAMRYQSGSYAERTNNAADHTCIRLNNFSAPGATMTVDVSTLIPTVANQAANTPGYTVTWGAASDASKYELQEGQKTVATSFSDGFEDKDTLHDNWVLASARRSSGGKRTGTYSMLFTIFDGSTWWNSVQSLRSRNTFKLTATTTAQFFYTCDLVSGFGQFRFQASNDDGGTWATLWTHSGGRVTSWTAVNITTTNLTSAGFSVGDDLRFQFVKNTEQISGWDAYPNNGWAIDDFSVSSTAIPAYTGWTTLNDNVASPSYGITGKSNGTYAYRVRGYANSAWQQYSPAATVDVAIAAGELDVTAGNLVSSGTYGGPFAPFSMVYTLENTGGTSIEWTATKSQSWVTLSAGSGTLASGASTTVTVSINSNANALDAGDYSDTVSFINTTNGNGDTTRGVSLDVTLTAFQQWMMDNEYDPATSEDTLASNGINTLREAYVAGIDPSDPSSRFGVSSAWLHTGDGIVLGWASVSGRLYSVYWSSNLLHDFRILQSNIPWTVESFTNTVNSAEDQMFYRISVQLENP